MATASVAAFVLIVSSWTHSGPVVTMQEFASEDSCKAAMDLVNKHLLPPGAEVLVRCVAK